MSERDTFAEALNYIQIIGGVVAGAFTVLYGVQNRAVWAVIVGLVLIDMVVKWVQEKRRGDELADRLAD